MPPRPQSDPYANQLPSPDQSNFSAERGAVQPTSFRGHKPANPRNLSHSSMVGGEQANAEQLLGLFQPEHQRTGQTQIESTDQYSVPKPAPKPKPAPVDPASIPAGQLSVPYEPSNAGPIADPTHYEFIMNPEQKSKPVGKNSSLPIRVAVIGGIALLLIVGMIVLSSLLKGGNSAQTSVVSVAQEQTELPRVAARSSISGQSLSSATKALVSNIDINVVSSRNQTLAYLQQSKVKYDPKQLLAKHSAQTDTTLSAAAANSNFESVFRQILLTDITNYANSLKRAYDANPGPKGQALLKNQYAGANLLLEQAKQN